MPCEQAAGEAKQQLEAAYTQLQQSWAEQRTQLGSFLQEQHEAAAQLLAAAGRTVALARQELAAASAASTTCQSAVEKIVHTQEEKLTSIEQCFRWQAAQEQVQCSRLLSQKPGLKLASYHMLCRHR